MLLQENLFRNMCIAISISVRDRFPPVTFRGGDYLKDYNLSTSSKKVRQERTFFVLYLCSILPMHEECTSDEKNVAVLL